MCGESKQACASVQPSVVQSPCAVLSPTYVFVSSLYLDVLLVLRHQADTAFICLGCIRLIRARH